MARNSKIEWTHHTFNPWWGCTKVSDACKHCYAEVWARRLGWNLWGPDSRHRFFTQAHWNNPINWNQEAAREGKRRRVFCASMADVFEDCRDLDPWRDRLWHLIGATPQLDWLLLTKRPERISDLAPLADELRFLLITSYARIHPLEHRPADAHDTELPGLAVTVTPSAHAKCTRCWHHRADVGAHPEHPDLCGRCVTNIAGDGENRRFA